MKKYLYAIGATVILILLFTVGFQFLYNTLTVVLGNFNNYLADLLVKAGDGLGPLLVGASFVYGVIHAVGPGHGKFVLSSYAIASNIKFFKIVILSLTISLLQGLTAVLVGTFALLFFQSSVTKFFKLSNSLLLVSSLMLISLGIFWFGRAVYRIVKLTQVVRKERREALMQASERVNNQEDGDDHSHQHCSCSHHHVEENHHEHEHGHKGEHKDEHKHSCCSHHHEENDKHAQEHGTKGKHKHSCCSHHQEEKYHEHEDGHKEEHKHSCYFHHHSEEKHEHEHEHEHSCSHHHHEGCGCKNHLDWEKYSQIDNFRDRMIMSLSVILRPCTGAIFVLIFAYSIDKWWWGVASAMVMALGTGIGLLFTVQIVTFIKRVGFDRSEHKPSAKRALIFQYLFAGIALTLIAVAGSAIYTAERGDDGNRIFTRRNDAPLLEQNNDDNNPEPLLEPVNQEFWEENLEASILKNLNKHAPTWKFKL